MDKTTGWPQNLDADNQDSVEKAVEGLTKMLTSSDNSNELISDFTGGKFKLSDRARECIAIINASIPLDDPHREQLLISEPFISTQVRDVIKQIARFSVENRTPRQG